MTIIAQGTVNGLVTTRWVAGNIAPGTSWVGVVTVGQKSRIRFALDDAFTVYKHGLEIFIPTTDTTVDIEITFKGILKTIKVNKGAVLIAGGADQFDLILPKGATYEIKHATGTQNVAVIITESFNVDI